MSNTDTSAIDEKKKTSSKPKDSILSFFLAIAYQLIALGVLIIIGAMVLYTGKVAQSNILPTCLAFAPYTDITPPIKEIPIDINVVKTDKGIWSAKLKFPLGENFKTIDKTLGALKDMINGTKSNVYKLYIATTLQEVIACNFNINNVIYNFINSILPETLIILLSPLIGGFVYGLTGIVTTFYLIILWFSNIHLLFSEKTETKDATTWKNGEMWGIMTWYWSLFYIFISIIAFFVAGISLIIPVTSFLISTFCMIFPLFMKSQNSVSGKPYGVLDTIKNILKFKMSIIMYFMSFTVILSAASNFGDYGYTAFVAIIACILLYFFSSIYKQYTPKGIDHCTFGLGDYSQVEKICIPTAVATEIEMTMFQKIENLFGGAKKKK